MKTASTTICGFLFSFCLLATACNNGSGDNNSDTTVGNNMPDSMGTRMENTPSGTNDNVGTTAGSNEDSSFVVKAMESNNEELILINAGIEQGANSSLKSDARKMLSDHTKLKTQLQSYATKKGYPAPQSDANKSSDDLEKLNKNTKGADWDKAWADQMEKEHKDDIDAFEKGEKNVKDSALHTIITATIPVLQSHLMHAEDLQKALK